MRRDAFRHLAAGALLVGAWTVPGLAQTGDYADRLTVHVEDAAARPGGTLAVVLRAYASRPIGQGQVCFTARPGTRTPAPETSSAPLLSYTDAVVFSAAGDVQVEFIELTGDEPPRFLLRFASPSATVNRYEGTFAAVFFRLRDDVAAGSRFALEIDPADTRFVDGDGLPIDFDVIPGELTVRDPADPYAISTAADPVVRGQSAALAVRSFEPVRWSAGRLGLRYDPAILSGVPQVRIDPRHGLASFRADSPTPGLLIVEFNSPDASLNGVPGYLIRVDVDSALPARPRASTRLWLDPALTWIAGADGRLLTLELADHGLELLPPVPRRYGSYP